MSHARAPVTVSWSTPTRPVRSAILSSRIASCARKSAFSASCALDFASHADAVSRYTCVDTLRLLTRHDANSATIVSAMPATATNALTVPDDNTRARPSSLKPAAGVRARSGPDRPPPPTVPAAGNEEVTVTQPSRPPDWERLAMDTRTSLDLLGENPPPCLLGGGGGSCHPDADHAAANLGALRALVQDLILRLRPDLAGAVWEGHRAADVAMHQPGYRHHLPGAPP